MKILHLLADEGSSKQVRLAIREAYESTSEVLVFPKRQNNKTRRECYGV